MRKAAVSGGLSPWGAIGVMLPWMEFRVAGALSPFGPAVLVIVLCCLPFAFGAVRTLTGAAIRTAAGPLAFGASGTMLVGISIALFGLKWRGVELWESLGAFVLLAVVFTVLGWAGAWCGARSRALWMKRAALS